MTKVTPPPITDNMVDSDGNANLSWILFFTSIFNGDTGTDFTPTFTSLTTIGVPTIKGRYYKINANLSYFRITITPATSTSSTSGTTYCDFPISIFGDGVCAALSSTTSVAVGVIQGSTGRIYPPSWTAITSPVVIVGLVEAR